MGTHLSRTRPGANKLRPGSLESFQLGRIDRKLMDDRDAFEAETRRKVAAMAQDPEVGDLANRLFATSDRYDFSYFWKWLGLPIIQTPDDIVAMQEIIWERRPQVIIETGFARGGSSIFYSSIFTLIGEGSVVSIDIDIRVHNREAVETHPLGARVKLVEGSSTAPATLAQVRSLIPDSARVMVILDSNHTHQHVLDELRLYGPLVTEGQFLVVSDTVIEELPRQTHRPREWAPGNNPKTAVREYLGETDRFEVDSWFNDKLLVTSSRGGYLRCVAP
jgi:cephalosporin hydroxylase